MCKISWSGRSESGVRANSKLAPGKLAHPACRGIQRWLDCGKPPSRCGAPSIESPACSSQLNWGERYTSGTLALPGSCAIVFKLPKSCRCGTHVQQVRFSGVRRPACKASAGQRALAPLPTTRLRGSKKCALAAAPEDGASCRGSGPCLPAQRLPDLSVGPENLMSDIPPTHQGSKAKQDLVITSS